jgi:hypothetical protein
VFGGNEQVALARFGVLDDRVWIGLAEPDGCAL